MSEGLGSMSRWVKDMSKGVCPKEYVEVKFQGYVQVDKVMSKGMS